MRALVIVAHPDDEVLGAGGTIAMLARRPGNHIAVLILGDGVALRHPGVTLSTARDWCASAAEMLGVTSLRFGGFAADGHLLGDGPQGPVVTCIARTIEDEAPDTIFTHHPGDIHVDHRVIADSVTYSARIMGLGPLREVLHCEVLSSTEQQVTADRQFSPNVYYDVSGFIDAKCKALACYPTEVFAYPHPRSTEGVQNLAAMRGATVGVPQAEAFSCARQLRLPPPPPVREQACESW